MTLKSWLALLLAVLLPLKGAMAVAGVPCHLPTMAVAASFAPVADPHGTSPQGGLAAPEGGQVHGADRLHEAAQAHEAAHAHAAAHAAAAHPAADGHGKASDASCRACAAICGASPLPPAIADRVPDLEAARDWTVLSVPEPPRLTLAGLERPPRTR